MHCPSCNSGNPQGKKFCLQCGARLEGRCPQCGSENPPSAHFCGDCGASLGAATSGATQTQRRSSSVVADPPGSVVLEHESRAANEGLEGERKTVTVLFADIKGSTELIRDLDPEEARAIVDPVLHLMMDAVHRYDGYVAQSTGDGILALFGAPVAHEDHSQRALHAAIAMRDELHRRVEDLRNRDRRVIEVRIGINTGEVVMRMVQTGGHTEYTPVGHATNLAARMQTLAPAGSIVVSTDTRRLVEGYFELRDLGPTEVKGISEPVNIYQVIRAGAARGHFELAAWRGLTKFVGREREVAELKRALELAGSGHGQLVAVVADAGTGKSRLFYEFKATLPAQCKLLEAYSVSHGQALASLPVLELLRGYFDLQDTDDAISRRMKVRTTLAGLDAALTDVLPYLLGLLGIEDGPDPLAQMDPQIKRWRTFDAIKRILVRESQNQPTVVIFEDLHWIDSETQALLDLMVDSIANSRVLLLVNYRPEYHHEWTNRSYYSQLRVDALRQESASEMLSALLGDSAELAPLKRLVIERTEGNPFFIEEMVQAMFDEGTLMRNGGVKLARSLSQLRLPPTVQGMLAARIDRLGTAQKELLQTLAVIGRESPLALVRQVTSHADSQLEQTLADLRAGEFIYEQPVVGDIQYIFKHALTQEVAYNSLLMERRKLLHERIGTAIEILFEDSIQDHITDLAYHYGRSGNIRKAVTYLYSAGRQLARRSAYSAALSYLNKGLQLLTALRHDGDSAAEELRLQIATAQSLRFARGWAAPDVEAALLRARELCAELGTIRELFPVLVGLRQVYFMRLDFASACRFAEELINLGEKKGDGAVLAWGYVNLAQSIYCMGDLHGARERCKQAIAVPLSLRTTHDLSEPRTYALSFMALILWFLGYPGEAAEASSEALAMAEKLPRPFSLATALFLGSLFNHLLQNDQRSLALAERAIAVAAEHGLSSELAIATFYRGQALAGLGSVDEGISEMGRGIELYNSTGARTPNYMTIPFAEAHWKSGRYEVGSKLLAEAEQAAHTTGELLYAAELWRVRGHLFLLQDSHSESQAEGCFRTALQSAREQGAKFLELRAAASFTQLLQKQGRIEEARTVLAQAYNWFSEGFDTADLKDAKSLLAVLN